MQLPPEEIRSLPQWVGWVKTNDGKKLIINPATGKPGSSTNPNSWGTFEEAVAACKTHSLSGIGIALQENGIVVIDLDHCLDSGSLPPLAEYIVNTFDSLTEISPSGKGLHIYVKGKLPNGNIGSSGAAVGIEAYENKRYITWTGNFYNNIPPTIKENQEALDLLPEFLLLAKSIKAVITAENGTGNQVLNDETFKITRDSALPSELIQKALLYAATFNGRRTEAEAKATIESAVRGGNRAASQKILAAQSASGDSRHANNLNEQFNGTIRWATHSGKWMQFTEGVWQPLDESKMVAIASDILLKLYSEKLTLAKGRAEIAEAAGLVREVCLVRNIKSALVFLAGRVSTDIEKWDKNPYLLNFLNGTLNMQTMEFYDHCPEDLITKQLDCAYDPTAECPTWKTTLSYVLDEETTQYVKRALGYSLSGDTSAQAMFVAWGSNGFNGKTTLFEGFAKILGPGYAMSVDPSLITGREMDLIKLSQLAQMVGVRFVHMAEMAPGQRLNESLIKQLTGGDAITAKFYHKNSFTFTPVAKLWLRTNDVPHVQSVTPAIWRRLKMIPFEKTIPESKRKNMSDVFNQFMEERAGIIAWAIRGWVEYQEKGLQDTKTVKQAIQEYKEESDYFAQFLEEETEQEPGSKSARVELKDLHRRYRHWSVTNGYDREIISVRTIAKRLRAMGITVENGTDHKVFVFGMTFKRSNGNYSDEF